MPIVRPTRWDHVTLPYVPAGDSPCVLFYLLPGDRVPRVAVPNARGEYPHLIPGMPYMEELDVDNEEENGKRMDLRSVSCGAMPVLEFAPPPLHEDVATQVDWEDLPAPPLPDLRHYTTPTEQQQEEQQRQQQLEKRKRGWDEEE
ncbi:hypothetical protein LSM04_001877 [Trypanosoma melophagium]|uniref:uncharacterized protein n=1 Tax=Trypanosoma melophagium TaxID=715481 RepID=UPI00351A3EAA|nr:hypothetical protein LSM04_001877 [Trypanosoma melophagium]